jgi:DNA-binding NtrC family response regulator
MTQTPHILIVDDEVDTCENLSDIFTDLGYLVDTAHNGLAALKLVAERRYDLALLDLRMPGMDGLELYRRIRQVSAGTVALVVTAYAASDTAQSILEAGAWKVVPKPVEIQRLLCDVQEAIDSPLVLVVDDDRELCENLWEILRVQGYRVHLAHDAQQAGEIVKSLKFEVVLLDMKLPGGDGLEVLNLVHGANPQARTVIITGYRDEMEVLLGQALNEGAQAIAYKPFDVDNLLQTVHHLVRQTEDDARQ